jgi:ferritin-like metal-binding protein YciE
MKNSTSTYLLALEKLSILFNSEKQFINYLQVIQNKSKSAVLQSLLNTLIDNSLSHFSQLNLVLKNLSIQPQGVTCEAMNGLIRENLSLISHSSDSPAKEHAMINFLQQVNRYKSTAYTWLQAHISEHPQLIQTINTIHEILNEEKSIATQITEVENTLLYSKYAHEQFVSYEC